MVGCCLVLNTDCWLNSSDCRQCCLDLYPLDGMHVAVGALSNSLEEAYADTGNWCHWSCIPINSLLGHVTLGCAIHGTRWRGHGAVHNWSHYTHWTWHYTSSDLLEYHTTCRCCTSLDLHAMGHGDAVNKGCVIGAAEADMMQHIVWPDRMLHDACQCCMPLDVLTAGRAALKSCVGTAMCRCTHWENTHLPRCCALLDMRCCITKVQSQSSTLSQCICSGAVAAFHRTGMWLACLSFSSQRSYVSFEQQRPLAYATTSNRFVLSFHFHKQEVLTPMRRNIVER